MPGEPQEPWDRRVYRECAASGEPIGEYLRLLHGEPQALPAYLLDPRPSAWLEDESVASGTTVERDLVPRVPSPPPPDATASDAYASAASRPTAALAGSLCWLLGAQAQREREQRVGAREQREAEDYNDGYERVMERAWHDEGRRSYFYGRPAAELSPDAVVPPEWEPPNALEAEPSGAARAASSGCWRIVRRRAGSRRHTAASPGTHLWWEIRRVMRRFGRTARIGTSGSRVSASMSLTWASSKRCAMWSRDGSARTATGGRSEHATRQQSLCCCK